MPKERKGRIAIENAAPEVDCGIFPVKRVVGEPVETAADIFSDGHEQVSARLLFRHETDESWTEAPMRLIVNDRWKGVFRVTRIGTYVYTFEGWIDYFVTWKKDIVKKYEAGQDIGIDMLVGVGHMENAVSRAEGKDAARLAEIAGLIKKEPDSGESFMLAISRETGELMDRYPDRVSATRYKPLPVSVDRKRALFGSWYEFFPRAVLSQGREKGTLSGCIDLLPEIAKMGFDILYLPPIHPIGETNRKGRNNSPVPEHGAVGSPWAIGSGPGGHKAISPELGTLEDFRELVVKAKSFGIEIAFDLAFQCSPDHPYVKEHPEWFRLRPDGTIQYAENPPKKYEDIFPINFENENWMGLWEELRSVVLFWIEQGIRIFRVDNPHTKPFPFWEWLISGIKKDFSDVIFLSEAFTRPKVMYRLAKLGFTQSYTYFTWRNTKKELTDYLSELTGTEVAEFFRPSFWPNTPDILPEYLQYGGRPAFMIKLVLAATLSSSYGIYGPTFELCVADALPGREEYLDSEKYEIRRWDWDSPGNLKDFIGRINRIRRENPALQSTNNLKFCENDNDHVLSYWKADEEFSNIILVIVNIDPYNTRAASVRLPLAEFGIGADEPFLAHDLLGGDRFVWYGERNLVELNPHILPAHIFRIRTRLKRETDFDYFM